MASNTGVLTAASPPLPYYSHGLRERFKLDALKPYVGNHCPEPECTDISYHPDETRYRARAARRVAAGRLPTSVPEGFPLRLDGPLTWKGQDLRDREHEFVYRLSDEEIVEIKAALDAFNKLGINSDNVRPSNFPLPRLANRLRSIRKDIYNGRGFAIIRGLDPDMFSNEDFTIVYLGLASYVAGRRGKQDQRGSMLLHVLRKPQPGKTQQNDDYNIDQPFHTDTVCDCLCLITKNCSAQGGRSVVASAWSVYNELAATRPDLIHTLAREDWPFDTYDRHPSHYRRAIMYFESGRLIVNLSRRLLLGTTSAPRSQGVPNINEAQAEAIDAVHFAARKVELRTKIERGDIRFINNMALLHCREAFIDDGARNTRHLIRLWLNNKSLCWKLPWPLKLAWARIFEDHEREEHWDLAPVRENGVVLRVASSCD